MKRGCMNGAARARSMRFEWQKLVTPLTPKAVVADYQSKDSEISTMIRESNSISQTVEPVDWAYWKTQITAPGVVEQMQKDYEALNFPKVEAYSPENKAKLDAIQESAKKAEKEAVHAANEVKEADNAIATVQKVKSEGIHWNLEQWQAFMPGLADQHKEEFEDEEYIVSEEMMKLDSVDWKAAAKQFSTGENPDIGIAQDRVGDMSIKEEVELVEAGKWSIARAFASKEERAKIQEKVEKALM